MARRIRPLTPERVDDLPDACAAAARSGRPRAPASRACGAACDPAALRGLGRRRAGASGATAAASRTRTARSLGFVKYAPRALLPAGARHARGSAVATTPSCSPACTSTPTRGTPASARCCCRRRCATWRPEASGSSRRTPSHRTLDRRDDADDERRVPAAAGIHRRAARTRATRCMRLELKSLAAWTENLEAVLESLQLPLPRRERVPAPLAGSSRRRSVA